MPLNETLKLNMWLQISAFHFLLDLIVHLPDSHIFTSMSFSVSFTSVKFRMLLTKTEFHISNICKPFSSIRSMVNKNLLRAKKIKPAMCRNYHQGSHEQASAVFQNYHYFCHNAKPVNKVLLFFRIWDKTS